MEDFWGPKKAITFFANCVQATEIVGLLRSGNCVKRKSLIVEDFWLNLKTLLYCPNIEVVIGNREGGTKYSHYAQFRVWVTTCKCLFKGPMLNVTWSYPELVSACYSNGVIRYCDILTTDV